MAMPSLWYGENRENSLLESSCGLSEPIAKEMGLPEDSFAPGYMGRSVAEQDAMYHALLLHTLHQFKSLGFKVVAICAGHYPLIDQAKAAAHIFHQQTYHDPPDRKLIVWVFSGYELVQDLYPFAGDHAAYWETSLLMALDPNMVDLEALPEKPEDTLGVGGPRPAQESDAAEGEKYVQSIIERVGPKVKERVDDPIRFMPHNLTW
jgi:creatinine amidohydrolase/Fe(II)-dependent formamide hydrolase-like protein